MTRERLKAYIVERLRKKYARQYKDDPVWAWGKVRDAVTAASASDKKEIIAAIENIGMVRKFIDDEASAEADVMLQDDSLDLNELARILEDT